MNNASDSSAGTSPSAADISARKRQNKAANVAFLRKLARSNGRVTNAGTLASSETLSEVEVQLHQSDDRISGTMPMPPSGSSPTSNEVLERHAELSNMPLRVSLQQQQQTGISLRQQQQYQQHQQGFANSQYPHSLPAHQGPPQMQRPQANNQFLSSLSPSQAQQDSANVQFTSLIPSNPPQQRVQPPIGEVIPPFFQQHMLRKRMLQRQILLQAQQSRQQARELQRSTSSTSLLSSDSALNDSMQSGATSSDIDRCHGHNAIASNTQSLESSSTSVSFEPPKNPKRKADSSETTDPAIPMTIKQNMHFANVAFLRLLSKMEKRASIDHSSSNGASLDGEIQAALIPIDDTVASIDTAIVNAKDQHHKLVSAPANSMVSSHSQQGIYDYNTYKQQVGLPNMHFFHDLPGDHGPSSSFTADDSHTSSNSGTKDSHLLPSEIDWNRERNPLYSNYKSGNASFLDTLSNKEFGNNYMHAIEPSIGGHTESKVSSGFEYPGLLNSTSSIRLLRMDTAPNSNTCDDIYCVLNSTEPWDSDVQYECLSYCWGVPTARRRIFVRTGNNDYQQMEVTDNLYNALQGLKASLKSTLYWIDAICIDQTNDTERGKQVSLMKDIYSKSSGVVVWLGPTTERLTAAVKTINDISKRFQNDTSISPSSVVGPSGLNLSEEDTAHLQSYTEYSYEEIAHFFSLPWFRRVWVLQEALSQATITVRLGTQSLHWGSIILVALWQAQFTRSYTATSASDPDGLSTHQFLPELWLGLLHTRMPRGLSMIELTSRARDFQATDPRDKVFALLGLANDLGPSERRPSGLVPDYSKSTINVYTDFARGIILKTRKLDVLTMVNSSPSHAGIYSFVSWMPDLNVPIATIRGLGFPEKYNASYSTKVDVSLAGSTDNELHVLNLMGFNIDTVRVVTNKALSFSRDLKLYLGDDTNAIIELWKTYLMPTINRVWEKQRLRQYIELLTAAGFALPTEFPAQPLGKVVPSRHVPSIMADFAAYWAVVDPEFKDFSELHRIELQEHAKLGDADQFGVLAGKACHERKFFTTAEGRIGLCPRETRPGDSIAILYGGSVPYVLAPMIDGKWKFIGECYVEGIMFGEAKDFQKHEKVFQIM
ncbi:hypothetical protein J1614_007876 [Plenodomus biglobosus]|nr:hypothetical protein J1614_007876 [Plenodomus biglobosus]